MMRILVVSNIYPRNYIGGYELGCQSMVRALNALGHDVQVVTSTYGVNRECVEGVVHRLLRINFDRLPSLLTVLLKERANQRHFRSLCKEFKPDIVFCWNMANISLSLVSIANDLQIPVSYYIFDNWLATCEMDQWFQHSISMAPFYKFLLQAFMPYLRIISDCEPLGLHRALFASNYLKNVACQTGKDTSHSKVLPWGVVPVAPTASAENRKQNSIIYVGQIVPLKGVHTVIESVGLLHRNHVDGVTLTIVGDAEFDPDYTCHLKKLVACYGIEDCVHFIGKVPSDQIYSCLASHQIFVFPSVWDEPFGISQLEAMACGLVIVGTATGGSAEILQHDVNALVFERENALDCARQIQRLVGDASLRARLQTAGISVVQSCFNFETVVKKMERFLKEVAAGPAFIAAASRIGDVVPVSRPTEDVAMFTQKLLSVMLLITAVLIKCSIGWLRGLCCKAFLKKAHRDVSLIIALGDSSDLVLASVFLQLYHDAFPERRIGIFVRSRLVYLIKDHPSVDSVIPFDVTSLNEWHKMVRGHIKWWFMASKIPASLFVDARNVVSLGWRRDAVTAASAILMHRAEYLGVSEAVGFRDVGTSFFRYVLDFFVKKGPFRRNSWNSIAALEELLLSLGGRDRGANSFAKCSIINNNGLSERATILNRGTGPAIAFAPGGDSDFYCWPLERYIELGNWLQTEFNASIFIIGLESDRSRCDMLYEELVGERKDILVGDLELTKIFEVVSATTLFCGNDNCFFYAAVLTDRSAVGLFGPGAQDRVDLAVGRQQIVRMTIPCSPCFGDCLYNNAVCLNGIDISQVKAAIRAKL